MSQTKKTFLTTGIGIALIASLCNLLWGSAVPFINLGYRSFAVSSSDTGAQLLFAGLRFILAGIITVAVRSIMLRRFALPAKGGFYRVIILAIAQTIVQYYLFYIGLAHTEEVKSSMILGLHSFVAILVACYLFRTERMTVRKVMGGLIGIAGVVVVQLNGRSISSEISFIGEGALILSLLANAISASLIKQFGCKDDPMTLSGWQFVLGGCVLALGGFILGGRLKPVHPVGIPVLLYLAVLSATAYSLWAVLLGSNPVSRIAAFMVLQPIFGVILTMILTNGNSPISLMRIAVSLTLVSLCIILITTDRKSEMRQYKENTARRRSA